MRNTFQQPPALEPNAPRSERPAEDPARARAPREMTIAEVTWSILERRWTVVAVAAFVFALGVAYLFVAPLRYESSILIQVEGRSRPVTAFEDLAPLFQETESTEGEMRILRSRTLLDAVVEQLGLDLEVRSRTLPVIGDAVARRHVGSVPAPARFGLARFAWGGEKIRVERLAVSDALVKDALTLTALEGGRYRVAASDGELLAEGEVGKKLTGAAGDRTLELLVAELRARPGTEFTVVKSRRIDVVEALQRDLRIEEQGRNTGLVQVTLIDRDPQRVAAILDSISTNYVRQSIERTSAEAAKTLRVLDAQLPVLKANLLKAETSLNAFRRKHGTVNLPVEAQSALARLAEIDRELGEEELRQADGNRYTEQHPDAHSRSRRTELLREQRSAIETRLRALPDLELESTRRAREMNVASELYVQVLNRAEQLRIVKSGWIGNVRVLERAAVPQRPVSPKRVVVLTLWGLLALAAGVAAALVRNAVDDAVRDPREIEAGTGIAVCATIPRSAGQRKIVRRGRRRGTLSALAAVDPGDPAIEDLRRLRGSVQFALRQARNNVVGVSGLAPRAGKSFISVNLAHLLAATDGRVLVIDADLRRGDLHRQFGVEARPGLSDVLSGAVALDAALRPTGTPNLDLLPAGTLPANPAELLAGDRLEQILAEVGRRYRVVIVDTSPILSVADSELVGRLAGVNLLVVRAGEHPVDEISDAVKHLARNGVTFRAAILNDLPPSRGRYGRSARYRRYALDGAARGG